MNLRLFALRDTDTGKLLPYTFFTGKPEAKRQRDELNQAEGRQRYLVTPGPDHRRHAGNVS